MTDALVTAQKRYTTKHYDTTKALSQEDKHKLFEILRLAPSSMNVQPWHFKVFETDEGFKEVMPFVADFNIQRVEAAPLLIVLCARREPDTAWIDQVFAQEHADGRYGPGVNADDIQAFRQAGLDGYTSGEDKGRLWSREQANIALGFLLFGAAQAGFDATALGGMKFKDMTEHFGWDKEGLEAVVGIIIGHRDANDGNATRPKSRLPHDKLFTHY